MTDDVSPPQTAVTVTHNQSPVTDDDVTVEVPLSEAVTATGVSIRTLRRWLDNGQLTGRLVDSQYGQQWLVSLARVKEIAVQKGIGHLKGATVTTDTPDVAEDTDHGSDRGVPPGQMLVARQDWERALSQMANFSDLASELGEAKEAKGRAEAKVETMREKLNDTREDLNDTREERDAARTERDAVLQRVRELEQAAAVAEALAKAESDQPQKRGWFRRRG